jgi:SAM-dependent methyltransferase
MSPDRVTDRLDFSRRADLQEWMDAPCSYAEFRTCLQDLERANRLVLAYRPTLQWIERLAQRLPSVTPIHIVDVGCGGGDMLRHIAKWAKAKGISVRLTGIDLNPYAARAASEFSASAAASNVAASNAVASNAASSSADSLGAAAIEWITGDAFSFQPAAPIDCVISSLFTHHLPDATLVEFVAWMERVAAHGWFINDLRRTPWAYHCFKSLAAVMHWHSFVRHDGPISIRRSFQPQDWVRICAASGIAALCITDGLVTHGCVTIEKVFPARLCVSRIK